MSDSPTDESARNAAPLEPAPLSSPVTAVDEQVADRLPGAWDWYPQQNRVVWDARMFIMMGVSRGAFGATLEDWMQVLHPEDRGPLVAAMRRAVESRGAFGYKFRLLTYEGEARVISALGRTLIAADGSVRIFGTAEAVASVAAPASETGFYSLVDSAPIAVVVETDRRITYINATAVRLIGAESPNQLIGTSVAEHIHPDGRQAADQRLHEVHPLGSTAARATELILRLDGAVVPADTWGVPSVFNGRQCTLIFMRDNTEQRKTEQALFENEDRMVRAQAVAHVGNWELDLRTQTLWASEEAFRIYGIERITPEIPMSKAKAFPVPEDRPQMDAAMEALIGSNTPYDVEFRLRRPSDGALRVIHSVAGLTCNQDGVPLKVVGVIEDITERKRFEESLRESEAKYRLLTESIRDVVWVIDVETVRLTYISPSVYAMRGYTQEELSAESVPVERLPIERKHWAKRIRQNSADVLAGKSDTPEYFSDEIELPCKDGSTIWTEVVSNFHRNEQSGRLELRGVTRDISARKRSEAALRNLNERLTLATVSAGMGVWEWDVRGNILIWDDRMFDIYGVSRGDFKECFDAWKRTLHPDDLEEAVEVAQQAVKGLRRYDTEFRIIRPDGEVRIIKADGILIRDESGEPVSIIGVNSDITEHKRAAEALVESEERLRLFVEHAPVAIAMFDNEMRYMAVSRRFLADYRLADADIIGRTHYEVFPDIPERWKAIHRRCLAGAIEKSDGEAFERGDGHVDWQRWEIHPWRNPHGVVGGIALFTEDISERRHAEEARDLLQAQLLQAQKMEAVGQLAGGVAHDFNNMLGVIIGHAEMTLDEMEADSPLRPGLEQIREAAVHSAELTRQLLAFARKQAVTPRLIDLNEAMGKTLSMLRCLIGENIDLLWQPGPDIWPIKIDPSQIDQILANLCVNARDAIHGAGMITIQTENVEIDAAYSSFHTESAPGEYVRLTVTDTGEGMDAETAQRVFEPFFTTKEVGKGTGLGLSTVYGAVKQNNGFVNVYSEPGQGSVFRIYLPRAASQKEANPQRTEAASSNGTETVLIVEDEQAILDLAVTVLKRYGYTVLSACAPDDAILLSQNYENPIHLLITDVVMPGMNGKELRDAVAAQRPQIKAFFMSGYTADVIAHHGVIDKDVNFLQKPFSIKGLAEKVREVLGQ